MGTQKGKRGEKEAKLFLQSKGWLVADRELQGLSGDDIFARDASGTWWAIEVKNTSSTLPKHLAQARRQGQERFDAIQRKLDNANEQERAQLQWLGVAGFDKKRWLLMWHPSNYNCRSDAWVVAFNGDNKNGYTTFLAPFKGVVDGKTWDS